MNIFNSLFSCPWLQKEIILVISMNSVKKESKTHWTMVIEARKEKPDFSVLSTFWWWNCIYHNGIILALSQCMKYEDREKPAWVLSFRTLWAVHVSEKAWSFLSNKGHNHQKRWENSDTAETTVPSYRNRPHSCFREEGCTALGKLRSSGFKLLLKLFSLMKI